MGNRAVTAGTVDRRLQPADLPLGDLDHVEAASSQMHGRASDLAEREADAVKELRMLLDEEARPDLAEVLFVAQDREDDVAGQVVRACGGGDERGDHHRHARLHVESATAPDLAVDEPRLEGRVRPALAVGRNDIDVAVQEQRRRVPAAAQPTDEVRARRVERVRLGREAGRLEHVADVLDARALVARRVRRVEADQLA